MTKVAIISIMTRPISLKISANSCFMVAEGFIGKCLFFSVVVGRPAFPFIFCFRRLCFFLRRRGSITIQEVAENCWCFFVCFFGWLPSRKSLPSLGDPLGNVLRVIPYTNLESLDRAAWNGNGNTLESRSTKFSMY